MGWLSSRFDGLLFLISGLDSLCVCLVLTFSIPFWHCVRFADAFKFLICLPKENHIWCGSWDIMGPLLETFYNYFKDEHSDSPLRQLWRRISEEMRQCIQCISQHYQALEMYSTEYESSSIGPLLDVLRSLDEERVTQHLIEINTKLARKEYDAARDNAEVISVMYEVCRCSLSIFFLLTYSL